MATRQEIADYKGRIALIKNDVLVYFDECKPFVPEWLQSKPSNDVYNSDPMFDIWDKHIPKELRDKGFKLRERIKQLSIDLAGAARGAPLITEADLSDLRVGTRRMLSAICFREYRYYNHRIHHNEEVIMAVDPPSQAEHNVRLNLPVWYFSGANSGIEETIDLLSAAPVTLVASAENQTYKANTAFIMMAINPGQPELDDVRNGIKDVCREFGIAASTIDETEHEEGITDRVLAAIDANEFHIADLTGERPNVYYDLGHAHARNKRVHIFCKEGTKVHFDISHRNRPRYKNVTNLKEQLRKRLETVTNKPRKQ